jgi:hypothetical protein
MPVPAFIYLVDNEFDHHVHYEDDESPSLCQGWSSRQSRWEDCCLKHQNRMPSIPQRGRQSIKGGTETPAPSRQGMHSLAGLQHPGSMPRRRLSASSLDPDNSSYATISPGTCAAKTKQSDVHGGEVELNSDLVRMLPSVVSHNASPKDMLPHKPRRSRSLRRGVQAPLQSRCYAHAAQTNLVIWF